MAQQFKLIPKMHNNQAVIYMALPSGNVIALLLVVFPNDFQVNDNCEALDDMVKILTKRIRKSI